MQVNKLTLCLALAFAPAAFAAESETMPQVDVTAAKLEDLPAPSAVQAVEQKRVYTSDSAKLLDGQPGVSLYGAGGVSSLPVIHGLADDRIRTKVDGMDLIASCPNHMNSPLSYVDPSNVGELEVFAGISPVSIGGDSIAGTIIANTKNPEFAAEGQGSLTKGEVGARYGSNGSQQGLNANVTVASEAVSMTYSGALAKSSNYKAAANFKNYTATGRTGHTLALDEVGSTAYDARNHTLGIALKGGDHLFEAKLGYQDIPFELYPNQRMDMLGNRQNHFNLRYEGDQEWGKLEARAYYETVNHYMDFGADKRFWYGTASGGSAAADGAPCSPLSATCAAGMPMYTEGKTTGASVRADILLTEQDLLRVGGEIQQYRLNDWWPPSGAGMWPGTFWNIKDGQRDRTALFGEWEARRDAKWMTLLGARVEQVKMNAGAVNGYAATNGMGAMVSNQLRDSTNFNLLNHKKTDNNWDLTALARYSASAQYDVEIGLAHKTRSPNVYERYTWSTWQMAALMNNFVGDGNGYLGDINLKPEKANTISATFDWHAADREWEFKATPYYTKVSDYIDAIQWNGTTNLARTPLLTNQFTVLKYANQSARMYGIDLSGQMPVARNAWGDWGVKGLLNYTNGKNQTTGDNLYNIMPLNAKVTLTQKIAGWDNSFELIGVERKTSTSTVRNEMNTPGYGLVNLRTSYTLNNLRLDFGVENFFDKMYYLPLGGAYLGQGTTMTTATVPTGSVPLWGTTVPGMGRSIYVGATLKF